MFYYFKDQQQLNNNQSNSLIISFLGPDGSGKSTIIDSLMKGSLPYKEYKYFHLKPMKKKIGAPIIVVTDPHLQPPYSSFKSIIKLLYFIFLYNAGWMRNIIPLKNKSSLVIFDRYFDDMIADPKRYRYGAGISLIKLVRYFVPKPDLYFVLTADAEVIHARKQEVPFPELERQIDAYRSLCDGKRYIAIDVNRPVEEITRDITLKIMEK